MIPDDRLARIEAAFAKHFPVEAAIASMMPPDPTPPGKCSACEGHGDIWTNWSPKPVQCGHCHGTGMIEADPTPARTVGENGVALCRSHIANHWFGTSHTPQHETTHVAFPKDETRCLLDVEQAARKEAAVYRFAELEDALDRLDAARKQGDS